MIIQTAIQTAQKIQPSNSIAIDTIKVTMADGEVVFVPMNNENIDYQTLLTWASIDGNTIADAD